MTKGYGRTIAQYNGRGTFFFADGASLSGQFRAIQLLNGDIFIAIRFSGQYFISLLDKINSFAGATQDGRQVSSTRLIQLRSLDQVKRSTYALFMLQEIVVFNESSTPTQTIGFGLTNLSLIKYFPLHFDLPAPIGRVNIHPFKDYDDIEDRLNITRGVEVTSELHVNVTNFQGISDIEPVVDSLCYILSIALGTKITWIYRKEYNKDRMMVSISHRAYITKPYSSLRIIELFGHTQLIEFVQQAYLTYTQRRDDFALEKGVIDAYLDAKAEADYLETRGAKLAVALEALKAVFVGQTQNEHFEYIIDNNLFAELIPDLKLALKEQLKKTDRVNSDQRNKISGKVRELNRRNFAEVLNALFKYLNFHPAKNDLDLFIRCRNSLVHQGKFYCVTATEDDRQKCPPKDNVVEEYRFMVDFLDRIFLKLLGYQGPYISHVKPGSTTTRNI